MTLSLWDEIETILTLPPSTEWGLPLRVDEAIYIRTKQIMRLLSERCWEKVEWKELPSKPCAFIGEVSMYDSVYSEVKQDFLDAGWKPCKEIEP